MREPENVRELSPSRSCGGYNMIILRNKTYAENLSDAELDNIKNEDKTYGLHEMASADLENGTNIQ